MDGGLFNLAGTKGRDCPICYRLDTLIGPAQVGAVLTCRECCRSFRYEPPHVARIDTSGVPTNRCSCGAIVGLRFTQCNPCAAEEAREARMAGR
jgi:hypothetical protein